MEELALAPPHNSISPAPNQVTPSFLTTPPLHSDSTSFCTMCSVAVIATHTQAFPGYMWVSGSVLLSGSQALSGVLDIAPGGVVSVGNSFGMDADLRGE